MSGNCADCAHSREYATDEYECRKNLPMLAEWTTTAIVSLFPQVDADNWCRWWKES